MHNSLCISGKRWGGGHEPPPTAHYAILRYRQLTKTHWYTYGEHVSAEERLAAFAGDHIEVVPTSWLEKRRAKVKTVLPNSLEGNKTTSAVWRRPECSLAAHGAVQLVRRVDPSAPFAVHLLGVGPRARLLRCSGAGASVRVRRWRHRCRHGGRRSARTFSSRRLHLTRDSIA